MKLLALALAFVFTSSFAIAADTNITTDNVKIGTKTNTDKTLIFDTADGAANTRIRANATTNKLQFSNDGTLFRNFGAGSGSGEGLNLLSDYNADFEFGATTNWTNSGLSVSTLTGSSALFDSTSIRLNASATDQTYTSDAQTVPAGLYGAPCLGKIKYNNTETDPWTYILLALDGSNNVLGQQTLPSTAGITINGYVPFNCPTSGSVKLQIKSTGDASNIDIDQAYLGGDNRLADVSQASLAGESYFAGTTSCTWTRTSATIGAFATTSACPGPTIEASTVGTWATTDSDLPKQTISNLPAGIYEATFLVANSMSVASASSFAINDGTTTCEGVRGNDNSAGTVMTTVTCIFTYTTSGTRDFQLYAASAANTVSVDNVRTSPRSSLKFILKRWPSASEIGVGVDQIGWRVDANITGTNSTLGTGAQPSYVEITGAALTLANNTGYGTIAAQIACATGNASVGTTCTGGTTTESNGIAFNIPQAGDVFACVDFAFNNVSSGGTSTFQIVETTNTSSAVVQESNSRLQSMNDAANTSLTPYNLCGTLHFTSAGLKTLRLEYEKPATTANPSLLADADASNGQRDIHWMVFPVNYLSGALPIFKGMVTSNSSSREHVERARITNAGSPSVSSQSGSWISGVALNGTGIVDVTFTSGEFSATPTCVCITDLGSGRICALSSATISSSGVRVTTTASTVETNMNLELMCMGPN
jgi:hypothetical protein